MSSLVAEYLRANKQAISDEWERAVLPDLAQLTKLDRGAVIDHLPEVLDALAAWLEGSGEDAERLFSALTDGHALQRLGYGIPLSVLNAEYGRLRHVLLVQLLNVPSSQRVREDLIRLDDGLDRAIQHAVHRYSERRDHLRDRFIGFLGHDLRNPLAALAYAGNLLSDSDGLGAKERNAVTTIGRSVTRMTRMVNDLLDFARGKLGAGIPTTPAECDMGELCQAVVDELRSVYPGRSITARCEGDLKGTFDAARVQQCLGNLVGNAVQHGKDPVVLSVREAEDRRALITRVSNRGKPLSPELLQRCFDPFASASESNGLGLGLYIVAEIARAHGGMCDVASTADETAFTILWPRSPRSETPQRP